MLAVILRSLKTGFTASAYWTVLKLVPGISFILLAVEYPLDSTEVTPSISFILLAVEGDVGINIEKLEDYLESLEKLLLLLAFTPVPTGQYKS
jgi:hypothetical protein